MKFPTLYKRTNAGKIQEWTMEVEGNRFRTISGQTDGKKVTSEWTACFGKNIGRANATTDDEQAMAEATSRFTKQKDKHYHEDIKDADVAKFPKAMLAHKYEEFDDTFPVFSQPKLDGIRCLITVDGMWTRGGKPIISAPHIFEAVEWIFGLNPELVLDGEIYTHKLRDDFNKIISLAKKSKPTQADLDESAEHLQYWMYDVINDGIFNDRYAAADSIAQHSGPAIQMTPTHAVETQEELDELYGEYQINGYEGQMIRKPNSLYEGKRTKSLLKRKEFVDEEFTIISLNEGKGNYAGMIKSVTLTDGNITFDSGIKGNQEFLLDLMGKVEAYPGKQATVRYQNKTPDGIPRFPVVYVLHETERW